MWKCTFVTMEIYLTDIILAHLPVKIDGDSWQLTGLESCGCL